MDIAPLLHTSSTHVDHLEPKSLTPSFHQARESHDESTVTTPSEFALASSFTHLHEVHSVPCPKIVNTFPMLAATNAAPSQSQIMGEIPSNIIILDGSNASENEQPVGSYITLTHSHQQFSMEPEILISYGESSLDIIGETSSYNITRGGRPIKPIQKIQDMEWLKVSGRDKQGRRG